MIHAENAALLLLAAGRSRRFDGRDKLAEEFLDKPLALHVVTALEAVPFARRVAVVSGTRVDFAGRGYEVVTNPDPARGMAHSLALGVGAIRDSDLDAVVIALADMPRVTGSHVYRLLDYATGRDAILASSNGRHPLPPALFGAEHFDMLMTLEGDKGARDMILRAHHVPTGEAELVDIDTPEDLDRLRALYGLDTDAATRGGARRSG